MLDDEISEVQKQIEAKAKEIQRVRFDPKVRVVQAPNNMIDVLESDKRRDFENKLHEEFDLLIIKRGELLAIKNGDTKPPFSKEDYFKIKTDIKLSTPIDNNNPFVSFLSEKERDDFGHKNFYDRGIYYG